MAQPSSVFAHYGSISGDSTSRHENSSFSRTSRTSDLKCESRVTQAWLDDQAPPGTANNLEEFTTRRKARISAVTRMVDDGFDSSWESEPRKMGKATNHHPHTVKTSPAQREKIVILSIPNGLEAKSDRAVGCSPSDPSTIVSGSKNTWGITQDGHSATNPSQDFHDVSMSILNEMQEGVIKKIMTKFWARFDNWLPKTTVCAGKSTTSQTTSNGYEGQGMASTGTVSSRRARNNGSSFNEGNGAEKPYDRPSKNPGKSGGTCNKRDRKLDFACPFKKRYPREYNPDEHRACKILQSGTGQV